MGIKIFIMKSNCVKISLINKEKEWKYIIMNPSPHIVRGFIKYINCISPTDRLRIGEKLQVTDWLSLVQKMSQYIQLAYSFSVKNALELIQD
jgi:hypothetical protein